MPTRILVIEDEATLRHDIVEMLEYESYTVTQAANGTEAVLLLKEKMPDLVLCDIVLPDFDGYRILEKIRNTEGYQRLPFIFLTAQSDRSFMRHGMELGADDYLTKPFSRPELLAAIQTRLERYRINTDLRNDDLENAKKRLSRMVAHELRTPLVSISMIEQLISNKLDTLEPEDMRDLLETLKSGSHRLQHLVEQMVLMTQLDTATLRQEDLEKYGQVSDIWSVLEAGVETARRFAYRHPHGQVMLKSVNEVLNVLCHTQALRHAFAEIIANALDFSPPGSTIVIAQKRTNKFAWITVVDNGPGMTTHRLQLALRPYEQINREKTEQQGMGLGLPLAKKLIELQKGDIIFRPVASGGTQVVIQIPLHNAE
jgi:two-component system sensor histidine kinase/response regulator